MPLSPMMQQYLQRKDEYADCILFFRLGDFYEMFFDDAQLASRELEITLTSRECGLSERAPMCGVPYHSSEGYIARLIEKGYKVAICEQITDPSETKGLVEREVVRVITPGTITEPGMLDEKKNNYILSVCVDENEAGLAWTDVSTGELTIAQMATEAICNEWLRIAPSEVLGNTGFALSAGTMSLPGVITKRPEQDFDEKEARLCLKKVLGVELSAYGVEDYSLALRAAGALLAYLTGTQKREMTHITALRVYNSDTHMHLDASARRNLELTETIRSREKRGTLMWLLDHTSTAMGARELRAWIEQPLADEIAIGERLDAVACLHGNHPLCEDIGERLRGVYDIERLAGRIAYGAITAKECVALKLSLERVPQARALINGLEPTLLCNTAMEMDPLDDVHDLLENAISPDPPIKSGEGGVIRDGFSSELDELRNASRNGQQWLLELEARERESTGIRTLKIGYNKVFGYYIEVSRSYVSQVPYRYQRKQTLAGGERYITQELKELEEQLLDAQDNALKLEAQLFTQVRENIARQTTRLQVTARALKRLDAIQSLATAAYMYDYVRPQIHDGFDMEITGGRHPVVERLSDEPFVPNDIMLDKNSRMMIITGPNMAGKSTYMRQAALIALMAHIGSFVPAQSAKIPVIDGIFTRVGASDDLSSGQSTFMVEMREVSAILAHATGRSLIILDEIGRGTSTFDGLAIAWASVEYISKTVGAKTLFATHYHELTELEEAMEGVVNYFVDCKEVGEDIIFLRQVKRGGADKSYGVHVAALAGLPKPLVSRAREIMARLEVNDVSRETISRNILDEPVGAGGQVNLLEFPAIELTREIAQVDVNAMTPMDALNALYIFREKAKKI